MVDGNYAVKMKTPMGLKKGELSLKSEGGTLSGAMTVLGKTQAFENGTTLGDTFCFSGTLKTAIALLNYTCEGNVEGDTLTASVKTQKGEFALQGSRI